MDAHIFRKLKDILEPNFRLVDSPYYDNLLDIPNNNTRLCWKLISTKKIINQQKQNDIVEQVNNLNLGETTLISLSGLGKYLIVEIK